MGLDTVELKGAPFDIKVSDGQKVTHGDPIAQVDLCHSYGWQNGDDRDCHEYGCGWHHEVQTVE